MLFLLNRQTQTCSVSMTCWQLRVSPQTAVLVESTWAGWAISNQHLMIWASDSETIRQKMMEISKLIGQLPTCSIHQLVNLLTLPSHSCCKFSSQISLVRRDRLVSVLRDTSSLRTKQSLLDLRLQMRHQEQLHRTLTSNSTRMPSPSQ